MKNLSLVTAGVGETDKTVMTSEQLAIKACLFFVFVRFLFFWRETEKTVMTSEQTTFNKVVSVFFLFLFCFVFWGETFDPLVKLSPFGLTHTPI